jgi:Uma2 family endonuclease
VKDHDVVRETAPKYGDDRVRLTYEDYLRMPAGLRYELVEGEMRMTPSLNTLHQEVSKRLGRLLMERLEDQGIGRVYYAPYDVVLSEHNVVQPDLLFVSKDRLGIIGKANVQGPPDLVIEILSESTEQWDRFTKRRVYARFGVREFWIVDLQAKTIEVASREGLDLVTIGVYPAGATARSVLAPTLTVEVDSLLRD